MVNAGTDLTHLVEDESVEEVYVGDSVVELRTLAEEIIYNQNVLVWLRSLEKDIIIKILMISDIQSSEFLHWRIVK